MDPIPPTDRTTVRRRPARGSYDRDLIHSILDEAPVCHVGFVVDGRPFVIPTLHVRVGDRLYVHGSPASRMLGAMAFLSRYPLYVVYRTRHDTVTEAFVLMGPTEPPVLQTELNLPLSDRVRAHLCGEETAFLAAANDPGRQLLLYPLSVFANRNGSEDLFLFEQSGVDNEGHAMGRFTCAGIRPHAAERIESRGIQLPSDLFARRVIDV